MKKGFGMIVDQEYLEHFGVAGMKWGVRKAPDRLTTNKTDTKITKEVKKDYNNSTNKEFRRKYAGSKGRYAKRVEKYGDPYKHRRDQSKGKVTDAKAREELAKIARSRKEEKESRQAARYEIRKANAQKNVDNYRDIANNKASLGKKVATAYFAMPVQDIVLGGGTQGGAKRILDRGQTAKAKSEAGLVRTENLMVKLGGVRFKDLDFSYD